MYRVSKISSGGALASVVTKPSSVIGWPARASSSCIAVGNDCAAPISTKSSGPVTSRAVAPIADPA